MNKERDKIFHIHLVSDATGETINSVAKAGLAQFEGVRYEEHVWSLVRTQRQLDLVKEGLRQWPGLILYTFMDERLCKDLACFCSDMGLPNLSILEPVLSILSAFFCKAPLHAPGRQHMLDEHYFKRIDAMEYALSLDDGQRKDRIGEADVVILGVSRTSKTPTSLYLSHRGIKVANIPIVLGIDPEIDFSSLSKPLVVGLIKDHNALAEIRKARMKTLNVSGMDAYIDPENIKEETLYARRLFSKIGCTVIDVTRKSIEETAGEIMMLLSKKALSRKINKESSP